MRTYLKILELENKDKLTAIDVKRATRRLILKYHPDINPQKRTWAEKKVKEVISSYKELIKEIESQDGVIYFKSIENFKKKQPAKGAPINVQEQLYLFLFQIGTVEFTLPIDSVREVMQYSNKLSITGCLFGLQQFFKHVEGIFHWRESCIPLVNLGEKANIEYFVPKQHRHIMIVKHHQQLVGFLIDKASTVIPIDTEVYQDQLACFEQLTLLEAIEKATINRQPCPLNSDLLFL